MTKKKVETDPEQKRKALTLFLLFFPTVIIMALAVLIENNFVFLALALLVAFLQLIGLKNFIDVYYS